MKAEVQSFFGIVGSTGSARVLKIPFFQREYVWNEENWEPLLDDLLDPENDHFLGSIIIKPEPEGFGPRVWNVIDGQQRLTTLSVLLKVCGEKILSEPGLPEGKKNYYFKKVTDALFVSTEDGELIKLSHSKVDRGAYETVLKGESEHGFTSDAIIKCKEYFEKNVDLEKAKTIFELLIGNNAKEILVGIILDGNDHEQAIFDTINTAGVRLTIADTVKNYIFQKYLGVSKNEQVVFDDYNQYWENVFSGDTDKRDYWSAKRSQGRIERTTLEVFLQCMAMVKGFFDPRVKDKKVSNLVDCYKEYIDKMSDVSEIRSFVREVADFANTYRSFFIEFKDDELLKWGDSSKRVLHILRTCDVSTFDPLILKLAIENGAHDAESKFVLGAALDELSSYVLRHVVAGATVKNFNKECASVIHGDKTISEYIKEKKADGEIADEQVRMGLLHIKKSYNKIAKEILLWMEAKLRAEKGADVKGVLKNHGYDLEHIMPQEWEEHWPITSPEVVDPETGNTVTDSKEAKDRRKDAVYEIGNMVLLNGSLNRGVQNREIEVKLNGDGARIKGIRNATPPESLYTQEVFAAIEANGYLWNEKTIRDRSKVLSDVFLSIW